MHVTCTCSRIGGECRRGGANMALRCSCSVPTDGRAPPPPQRAPHQAHPQCVFLLRSSLAAFTLVATRMRQYAVVPLAPTFHGLFLLPGRAGVQWHMRHQCVTMVV